MERKSIFDHAAALRKREYSAEELCREYLRRKDIYNAYTVRDEDGALETARAADRRLSFGAAPLLCGIPFAVKDNICTKGLSTTAGSRMLWGYEPPYSATVVERLLSDGAVLLGKTNMDEFAMGCSTETSAYGPCRNPRDTSLVPGGSSGGSAAAVAADLCAFALGSDTGGSVRQPAAFCSVVGLCPTYGALSRYGLIAFASSLDRIGILSGSVADAAAVLSRLCKRDVKDPTTCDVEVSEKVEPRAKGIRIGIAGELFAAGVSDAVRNAVMKAAEVYRSLGAELVGISLPSVRYATEAYYIISSAEASSCLARYDGVRFGRRSGGDFSSVEDFYKKNRGEGFGSEVKRRIMLGTFVLSALSYESYYEKATKVRRLVAEDYERAFEECDAILSPTSPTLPYPVGAVRDDPTAAYAEDICTASQSLAGLPSVSIPCGDMIGLQLTGPRFSESFLLSLGAAYEEVAK